MPLDSIIACHVAYGDLLIVILYMTLFQEAMKLRSGGDQQQVEGGICLFYIIRFTCMEQQCRSRSASKHMKIISTKHFILQIAVFGGENNVQQ